MKIIDLSKPIQYNKNDPWLMKMKIKRKPHRKAKWLIRVLGLSFKIAVFSLKIVGASAAPVRVVAMME